MGRLTLDELVDRVEEIPAFPQTVIRSIQLIEDSDSNVREIEKEVMKDQGLTAKILRLANSSYYGLSRNIKSVAEATVLLGYQAIKSMVLATTVGRVLDKELPAYALDRKELWHQSQVCAITARKIAVKSRYINPDEAYTAGLLRDIGKVILDEYLEEEFDQVLNLVRSNKISFMDAEEQILGYNHGQVGAKIAEKWHLPVDLVESIQHHHNPELAVANPKMTAMVHIADGLVMMMGYNLGADGLSYYFSESAMALLGLNEVTLQEIMSDVTDMLKDESIFL